MSGLTPARQNALLLIALLFSQLLLMSGSTSRPDGSTSLERATLRVTEPVIALGRSIGGGVRGLGTGIRDLSRARVENTRLREELNRLRGDVRRHREEARENERLRLLLGMRDYVAPKSVGASVVIGTLNKSQQVLMLDRGAKDGVEVEAPVVAWDGVAGRVVTVFERHAKVRLLSDPSSGIAGRIERTGEDGFVFGQADQPMQMRYVVGYADVIPGDRVKTSGLDGIFPEGLLIGTVSKVGETTEVEKEIAVEPAVDFSKVQEVLVFLEPGIEVRSAARDEGRER
jgi:rod shape-determining protein MreC